MAAGALSRREVDAAVLVAAEVAATVHLATEPPPAPPRPVRPPATGAPVEPVELPLPATPPAERPAARAVLVGELVEPPRSALAPSTLDRLELVRREIAAWQPAPCPPRWVWP